MLVCHTCLHLSTQSTSLARSGCTVGSDIPEKHNTRDGRNVKCHFCNTRTQGIFISICKEKWPKSICEANSRRLLQKPAAKQLPASLTVREEVHQSSRIPTYNQLLSSSLPLFLSFRSMLCTLHAWLNDILGTQLVGYGNWPSLL